MKKAHLVLVLILSVAAPSFAGRLMIDMREEKHPSAEKIKNWLLAEIEANPLANDLLLERLERGDLTLRFSTDPNAANHDLRGASYYDGEIRLDICHMQREAILSIQGLLSQPEYALLIDQVELDALSARLEDDVLGFAQTEQIPLLAHVPATEDWVHRLSQSHFLNNLLQNFMAELGNSLNAELAAMQDLTKLLTDEIRWAREVELAEFDSLKITYDAQVYGAQNRGWAFAVNLNPAELQKLKEIARTRTDEHFQRYAELHQLRRRYWPVFVLQKGFSSIDKGIAEVTTQLGKAAAFVLARGKKSKVSVNFPTVAYS